jgi:hypothetical protein
MPAEISDALEGCETDKKGDVTKGERKRHYLFFALRIAATQFMADIAGQVLEAMGTECSKLLASLVTFGVESRLSREEGD